VRTRRIRTGGGVDGGLLAAANVVTVLFNTWYSFSRHSTVFRWIRPWSWRAWHVRITCSMHGENVQIRPPPADNNDGDELQHKRVARRYNSVTIGGYVCSGEVV